MFANDLAGGGSRIRTLGPPSTVGISSPRLRRRPWEVLSFRRAPKPVGAPASRRSGDARCFRAAIKAVSNVVELANYFFSALFRLAIELSGVDRQPTTSSKSVSVTAHRRLTSVFFRHRAVRARCRRCFFKAMTNNRRARLSQLISPPGRWPGSARQGHAFRTLRP